MTQYLNTYKKDTKGINFTEKIEIILCYSLNLILGFTKYQDDLKKELLAFN